jgi:predicted nucleotidyltransferase
LVGLRGLESAAFSRVIEVPFMGERLRIIGREDFIAMKLFAGGPQDLEDARFALAAVRDSIDIHLLKRLASRYGDETDAALSRLLAHSGGD